MERDDRSNAFCGSFPRSPRLELAARQNRPIIDGPVPGPNAAKLLERQRRCESSGILYPTMFPFAPARAWNCWIEDVDGNVFLDFASMAGAVILGHHALGLDDFLRAAQQLTTTLDFPTEARVAFLEAFNSYMSGALASDVKTHLTGPTGANAIEAALKLCRYKTGRSTILAFTGGYHGMSAGASAISDLPRLKLVPQAAGTLFAPFPDCFRCPYGLKRESCSLHCLLEVDRILEASAAESRVAAAVIEPVRGEGGSVPVPEGYLEELHAVLRRHGALLVVDEVQCGFGRTGRLFAFEYSAAFPDVVVFSKGVSGVGAPMAGIVFKAVLDGWPAGAHTGTFRGFVPALAAASSSLHTLLQTPLLETVRENSALLNSRLKAGLAECAQCGDVRARGYMFGIELVKNRTSCEPFPALTNLVARQIFQRGILVETGGTEGNVLRLLPPVTSSFEALCFGMDILTETIRQAAAEIALQAQSCDSAVADSRAAAGTAWW